MEEKERVNKFLDAIEDIDDVISSTVIINKDESALQLQKDLVKIIEIAQTAIQRFGIMEVNKGEIYE